MNSELHAGPIMDKVGEIPRNCETTERNSDCYYLGLGCLGCTFESARSPMSWAYTIMQLSPAMSNSEINAAIERIKRIKVSFAVKR